MVDLHPGHDKALVERFIMTWREEFDIVDSEDHVEIGPPLDAAGACRVTAKSPEGEILIDRLIAAGVLEGMQ